MSNTEYENDTIVAQSSPPGRSGVGLIRVSGPHSVDIINSIFKSRSGSEIRLHERRATYGFVIHPESGRLIDDCLAVLMPGPGSYTGEDVVELSLHGSPVILNETINLVISLGARLAQRGEFTRRAFLSGRMDLIQAEAVVELIEAETAQQADDARMRIDKRLSGEISSLSSGLKDIGAEIEAFLDFDDDEEGVAPHPIDSLSGIHQQMGDLLKSADSGRFARRGLTAVIVGKPNVGKSTLFNLLLGSDRMITSPTPGTTRDPVSEKANINGISIRLGDTAGIRQKPDPLEEQGISRTLEWLDKSDMVLLVTDASSPLDPDDIKLLESVGTKPGLVVINKIDIESGQFHIPEPLQASHEVVRISAREGWGVDELKSAISLLAESIHGSVDFSDKGSLNERAILLMRSAAQNVRTAIDLLGKKSALELVSFEIKSACDRIDEITGGKFTDDVLDRIFERFCVGK